MGKGALSPEVPLTFDEIVDEAVTMGAFSPCQKSKRVVAIFDDNGVMWSMGYNSPPYGFVCTGNDECKSACGKICTHAEQSALLNELKRGRSVVGKSMLHIKVVDEAPVAGGPPSCVACSKLILDAGIRYMWLYEDRPTGPEWVKYTAHDFHKATLVNCKLPCKVHFPVPGMTEPT
jgi:deoxycytidylate deaminase